MRLLLLASLLSISTVGCISHVKHDYLVASTLVEPAAAGPFNDSRAPIQMQRSATRDHNRHYKLESFRFPGMHLAGKPGKDTAGRLFSGKSAAPRPVVIVLPVWGISEYPSRQFTRQLLRQAKGEIDVMLVESEDYLIDWEALTNAPTEAEFESLAHDAGQAIRSMVIDVRRIVDWLGQQPQTDADAIGIIGFSLSAVVTSLALQHEPRFAAGAVVLGGSNPAEIFATCGGRPKQVREAALQRFDWSLHQYQNLFEIAFAGGDARDYAGRINDASRLLFIEAARDDCMTQASRNNLWHALGQPQRISFNFDHRGTFYAMTPLGLNVLSRYAASFLRTTLQRDKP